MGFMTVKLYGENEAIAELGRFAVAKRVEVRKAIVTTALNIQRMAKRKAPVDTGRLRSSIIIEYGLTGLGAEIGSRLDYAVYQEYGTGIYAVNGDGRKTPWVYFSPKLKRFVWTRGNKPQPFLMPAYQEEKPEYYRRLREAMRYEG